MSCVMLGEFHFIIKHPKLKAKIILKIDHEIIRKIIEMSDNIFTWHTTNVHAPPGSTSNIAFREYINFGKFAISTR